MKRNTMTGFWLAMMIALSGLALLPVGAQAENVKKCEEGGTCPRFLNNGTEAGLENGELLPIMSWGTLRLTIEPNIALVTCRTAIGGVATDPGLKGAGDKRGEAQLQSWTFYNCKSPICELPGEPIEVPPLGQGSNPVTKTKETVERITTPWEAHLNEPKEKEWQLKIGNKTAGSETKIRFRVDCAGHATQKELTGELTPVGTNGVSSAAPAQLEFKEGETGTLEGVEPTRFLGKVKLMGYTEQQVLLVMNQ